MKALIVILVAVALYLVGKYAVTFEDFVLAMLSLLAASLVMSLASNP